MTSVPAHIGLEEMLELTRDRDPRKRKWAVRQLCPCHLKYNVDQVWDRLIPLSHANFAFIQLGDPEFKPFATESFHSIHSVLMILFPDGTTMFLAEPGIVDNA